MDHLVGRIVRLAENLERGKKRGAKTGRRRKAPALRPPIWTVWVGCVRLSVRKITRQGVSQVPASPKFSSSRSLLTQRKGKLSLEASRHPEGIERALWQDDPLCKKPKRSRWKSAWRTRRTPMTHSCFTPWPPTSWLRRATNTHTF